MSALGPAKVVRSENRGQVVSEGYNLDEIVIGKDVLELVSSAMYVDPMTVYREYVQNAADAVDVARAVGVLGTNEPGRVDISVDPASRTVRIRDNGCGIPFVDFGRKLTALGGSGKRGTQARGFRGVGRLAGLGYAQEVIFRSRVAGETCISELRWDCRQLKAALREQSEDMRLPELIRSVTELRQVKADSAPERFFEVELRGIVRLRTDRLMSPAAIGEYLSQVAPVPFSPEFRFADELNDTLARHMDLGTLEIWIDNEERPVFRPHRNSFGLDEKHTVTFDALDIIEVPGIDGQVAAVAWILHHDYEGALPTNTLVKGLRLRAGNIQVGDHTLLEELFPEPRFNVWSVGEVHVVDRRVVPNGRRDQFEQNAHFHNLLNHLTPTARDITRRCRTNSIRRKWLREFELYRQTATHKLDIAAQGSLGAADRRAVLDTVVPTLSQLDKIASMAILADEDALMRAAIVAELRARAEQLANDNGVDTSPLAHLPSDKRAMYEHLFGLVYECSTNRIAAKALVDRILERLRSEPETP